MALTIQAIMVLLTLSQEAERYEDMRTYAKQLVELQGRWALTVNQMDLVSLAYKNVVGAKRSAWRVISSIEAEGRYDETIVA